MNSEIEHQVGAAFNALYGLFGDRSYDELVDGFRRVEEQFQGALGETELLEVRRRIAEGIFAAAQATDQSMAECQKRLEEIERLGWTNLYIKAQVLFPFCRYALDRGNPDIARQYLQPLIRELELEHARSGDEQTTFFLNHLRPLLDR